MRSSIAKYLVSPVIYIVLPIVGASCSSNTPPKIPQGIENKVSSSLADDKVISLDSIANSWLEDTTEPNTPLIPEPNLSDIDLTVPDNIKNPVFFDPKYRYIPDPNDLQSVAVISDWWGDFSGLLGAEEQRYPKGFEYPYGLTLLA